MLKKILNQLVSLALGQVCIQFRACTKNNKLKFGTEAEGTHVKCYSPEDSVKTTPLVGKFQRHTTVKQPVSEKSNK